MCDQEEVFELICKLLSRCGAAVDPEKPLPEGFIKIEIGIQINNYGGVMGTKIESHGNVGNIVGRDATISGSVTVTDNSTTGIDSADITSLLNELASAVDGSELSGAKKGLALAQVDVLREEAAKPASERDGVSITSALEGVKTAAGTATAIKKFWDSFGDSITGWFS